MRLFFLLLACSLAACMGTKVEVDKKFVFDPIQYREFAWASKPMVDSSGRQETLVRADAILRTEVDRQLQSRGYKAVASESADFFIDYQLTQTMEADQGGIISPTDEAAASWDVGGDSNKTRFYNHAINAYILHSKLKLIITNSEGKTLWQAQATELVDNESPSDKALQKNLAEITSKMFRGFPRLD